MSSTTQQSMSFLPLTLLTFYLMINSAESAAGRGAIAVQWGNMGGDISEGTLREACATGNYNIVIIDSLFVHDDGTNAELELPGHCGNTSYPCTKLESEVAYCQSQNVQVFLSISKSSKTSSSSSSSSSQYPLLSDSEDVSKKLASYLLKNFFSGELGPLGRVTLDGVNLMAAPQGTNLRWDAFVKAMANRKVYLALTVGCKWPNYELYDAIQTGIFDHVYVNFFEDVYCTYNQLARSADKILKAWTTWTLEVPKSLIFLELAASNWYDYYIEPSALKSKVLPTAKSANNYGGVVLFNRYFDKIENYSGKIKDSVIKSGNCKGVCDDDVTALASF